MSSYDGDVRVEHSPDGGLITFVAGQPIMDQGLSTAVYLSLWTAPGWWGNAVAGEYEDMGSDCEALELRPLTNKTRLDYEESARKALAWMVFSKVAKSVTVEAVISNINVLSVAIAIEEPDGIISNLKYKINWQGQRALMEVH
jgi:phage gp46-like protein